MEFFLFGCPECHTWQGLTDFQIAAKKIANALNSLADPKSKEQDPLIVACPKGCGLMTQVGPNDRLQIMPAMVEKEGGDAMRYQAEKLRGREIR